MRIVVVTLFPDFVEHALRFGVLGRAIERGVLAVETVNPRQFATDVHRTVDDRPYGGGPGMVLKAEPLRLALDEAMRQAPAARRIYLAADGAPVTQRKVAELSGLAELVLVAGRYEGVDERFVEACTDESLSVGDVVLSGGELPALVVIDAVARLLPGTLGDAESAVQESFTEGLLDWPHYTRPEVWSGQTVPAVLLGGNHAAHRPLAIEAVAGPDVAAATGPDATARIEQGGARAPRRIPRGAGCDATWDKDATTARR